MKTIKYLICLLALITVRANAQSTLEVWTEKSTEITADGTTVTYLTFYQKDPNINYISFQAVITVPKGIKINQIKSGRLTVNDIMLCQDRVYDHTIACNLADENTIKISAMSSTLQEFYPDDEVLEVIEFDIPGIKTMVKEFSFLCKGRFGISC